MFNVSFSVVFNILKIFDSIVQVLVRYQLHTQYSAKQRKKNKIVIKEIFIYWGMGSHSGLYTLTFEFYTD